MRRGLLKDLANTPTQIVCGYRLYSDIKRLAEIGPHAIKIDLLTGDCSVDEAPLEPPLSIAGEIREWMDERFANDDIPPGLVVSAMVTLVSRPQAVPNLSLDCLTVIATESETFTSHDIAFWHSQDINDL